MEFKLFYYLLNIQTVISYFRCHQQYPGQGIFISHLKLQRKNKFNWVSPEDTDLQKVETEQMI